MGISSKKDIRENILFSHPLICKSSCIIDTYIVLDMSVGVPCYFADKLRRGRRGPWSV